MNSISYEHLMNNDDLQETPEANNSVMSSDFTIYAFVRSSKKMLENPNNFRSSERIVHVVGLSR